MPSVTQRINEVKQPHGGYLPLKDATITQYEDGKTLAEKESVSPAIVGIAVDYLTRIVLGTSPETAFSISLRGAAFIDEERLAKKLLAKIKGLDDKSIDAACRLSGFDVVVRAGKGYKDVSDMEIDKDTIENIRTLVSRSVSFWNSNGPIVKDGYTFMGGYTDIITSGDGDYLTADTLWDMKVSVRKPTSKNTLQILVYYLMGCHSIHQEFQNVKKLGIFNPRLNTAFTFNITDITSETIAIVEKEVIGYGLEKKTRTAPTIEKKELTTKEAAAALGVSTSTILNYIHSGDLAATKKGNKYIINAADLEDFAEEMSDRQSLATFIVLVPLILLIIFLLYLFMRALI